MNETMKQLMSSLGMDGDKASFSKEEVEDLIHLTLDLKNRAETRNSMISEFIKSIDGPLYWVSSDLTYLGTNSILQGDLDACELVGRKVGESRDDEYLLHIIKDFFDSSEENYSWDCKLLIDGKSRWFSMNARKYNEGKAVIIFGQDIKNLQKISNELVLSEKKFQDTMEFAPIVMAQVDEDLNVIQSNELYGQMMQSFSYKNHESLSQVFCLENLYEIKKWMLQTKNNPKKKYSKEINLCTKSIAGEPMLSDQWILLHSSLLDRKNGLYIFMMQDITEQKKSLKALDATNLNLRYTEKMVALGEMASGLAHEVNNPLAIIDGRASLLLESVEDGELNSKIIEKSLKSILKTSRRIADVVKGLKTFASQSSVQDFELTGVTNILSDLMNVCNAKAREVGVELTFKAMKSPKELDCRPADVVQALENFVQNAIDAAKVSKEKWVRVYPVETDSEIQFYIEDSGSGIESTIAPKIFQPFFTTKEVGQGMGLGLSYAKGIVESHSGKIGIDYSVDFTRFIVGFSKEHFEDSNDAKKVS